MRKTRHCPTQVCFVLIASLAPGYVAWSQSPSEDPSPALKRAMEAGAEAMHNNNPADAEASFREATRLAPRYPSAFLDLGLAELRSGELETAEQSIRTACQLDPKLPGAHMFLGVANYQLHRLDKAREALREEIALTDTSAEAEMWLGVVELADGKPERAVPPWIELRNLRRTT